MTRPSSLTLSPPAKIKVSAGAPVFLVYCLTRHNDNGECEKGRQRKKSHVSNRWPRTPFTTSCMKKGRRVAGHAA
jgi:hypothetical protein